MKTSFVIALALTVTATTAWASAQGGRTLDRSEDTLRDARQQAREAVTRILRDRDDSTVTVRAPRTTQSNETAQSPATRFDVQRDVVIDVADVSLFAQGSRMSPGLRALYRSQLEAQRTTRSPLEPVRVEFLTLAGKTDLLAARVRSLGGRVERTVATRVFAELPVEALAAASTGDLIRSAYLPTDRIRRDRALGSSRGASRLFGGPIVTEGVVATGADQWQATDTAAFGLQRATPVRVAVIDSGFENYASRLGTELPASVQTFVSTNWDIEGCPPGVMFCVPDGTAVAEIVFDMAPNVELYLVSIDVANPLSMQEAVDFLLNAGSPRVDLIVSGLIFQPGPYGDGYGAGPIADAAQQATDAGVTWIHDVGDTELTSLLYLNFLPPDEDHWAGTFTDDFGQAIPGADSDGYMDTWFEANNPASGDTWINEFCLGPGDRMFFDLIWDDWVDADASGLPEASQDFILDVYELDGAQLTLVGTSEGLAGNQQTGAEGDYPWETFDFGNPGTTAECFFLAIFASPGTDTRALNQFHLFWGADNDDNFGTLTPQFQAIDSLTAGNRTIPADVSGVSSVAATGADDNPEPFAASGFVSEGVPRLCAPDRVTTSTFPADFLPSFGAAHVAGAVALMMDKVSFMSGEEALSVLDARAENILGTAPDNLCGSGGLCTLVGSCP